MLIAGPTATGKSALALDLAEKIGGTVINILAAGITGFLNRQLFFGPNSVFGGQVPNAPALLPHLRIPILADLPLIGSVARTYRGLPCLERRELIQEGVLGLIRARPWEFVFRERII